MNIATSNSDKLYWASRFYRGCRCKSYLGSREGKQCLNAFPRLARHVDGNDVVDFQAVSKLIQDLHLKVVKQENDELHGDEFPDETARLASYRKNNDKARRWALKRRRLLLTAIKDDDGSHYGDVESAAKGAIQFVLDEATVFVGVADFIDVAAEQARLNKELVKQQSEIERFEKKLANEKFVANAPEAVVEAEREKLADAQVALAKLTEARERLFGVA